jgi:hypothetical protein
MIFSQTTYYVNPDATGTDDGSSWTNAFIHLQDALAAAGSGGQIWVAKGTYYPDEGTGQINDDRSSSFILKNGVAIYGGFKGGETQLTDRDWKNNETILSGDLKQDDGANFANNGDNASHVVQGNGTDSTPVLDGFTITAGNANGADYAGGGMFNENSSPSIANCNFSGNMAIAGGGMYNVSLGRTAASPTLINCSFLQDSAQDGGGMYTDAVYQAASLVNCRFWGNSAKLGGGFFNQGDNSTLINCSFSQNRALNGGGYFLSGPLAARLTNCIFWGDTGGEIITTISPSVVTYSIVQGGYTGTGNKDEDPLFADAANGNLRLQPCSPAINMGLNSVNTTATDPDGNARINQTRIDMGAYESQNPVCCPPGNVLYVKKDASGSNNGTSWVNAFNSLQDALAQTSLCANVTQIWVAAGTYYPDEAGGQNTDDRNSSFLLKNGVAIYGGFNGTETQLSNRDWKNNETILSGDLQQNDATNKTDNAYHVVQGNGTDNTAMLDGFTITAGNADGAYGTFPKTVGGGMYNDASSPTIINCNFSQNNTADGAGAGMYNNNNSSPSVTNCSFLGNSSRFGEGGAISNINSSPTITNCLFSGNSSGYGGAISNSGASLAIVNSSFAGNQAFYRGGAIYNDDGTSTSLTLINCILWGDVSTEAAEIYNLSTLSITYSIVQGTDTGTGNKNGNPLFMDAGNGDLHLQRCSPAIDAGSDAANSTTVDLDGNSRKVDAIPGGGQIDMGAYEFQGTFQTYYRDFDRDNFGDPNNYKTVCSLTPPAGYVTDHTDCNDSNANEHPGQTWYKDADGDGYSDGTTQTQCVRPSGYKLAKELTATSGDCDDNNAAINPATVWYKDADGDGYSDGTTQAQCTQPTGYKLASQLIAIGGDCDDNNAAVNPASVWYKDADGDGYSDGTTQTQCARPAGYKLASQLIAIGGDCDDNNAAINPATVWYKDADGDGYSDGSTQTQCTQPAGYKLASQLIAIGGDCDDNNAAINPATVWYKDADGDGYSDGTTKTQCAQPAGYKLASQLTAISGDCDDNNAAINPATIWYKDADNDGYSDGTTKTQCAQPAGYKLASQLTATSGDCNDNDAGVHSPITYYRDMDGDGYGSSVSTQFCLSSAPAGYSARTGDCNDNDPAINPGAVEVCGNKVDDNCNGVVDEKTCYACQNGNNLTTTNITSNSAQLNWTAIANPQQWQLEYKSISPGSQWIDVLLTGNIRTVKITALKAKQSYNWHIRAKCNGTWTNYSNAVSFVTLANGMTVSASSAIALDNSLKLYPNPSNGQFIIELNLVDKINAGAEIQLIDLNGKTVQTENSEVNNGRLQMTMNVSSALARGIYLVRITAGDRICTAKLFYEE